MNSWGSFKSLRHYDTLPTEPRRLYEQCGKEGSSIKPINLQVWAWCLQLCQHLLLNTLGSCLHCHSLTTFLQPWLTPEWLLILEVKECNILNLLELANIPDAQIILLHQEILLFVLATTWDYKTICFSFTSISLPISHQICYFPNRS